jgi:Protein of unknown function (DUF3306)
MKQVKQESRLSRWSRRKQQTTEQTLEEDLAQQLAAQEPVEVDLPATLAGQDVQEAEASEAVLTDADMPAIESLSEDSNFSQFMSSGVTDELRNLALRKMFKAPFFNIRDGLDEYDEDFTTFEKLGDIVTCDMRHQIEVEAKKKLEAEAKEIAESGAGDESAAAKPDGSEDASTDKTQHLIVDVEDENLLNPIAEIIEPPVETKAADSSEPDVSAR